MFFAPPRLRVKFFFSRGDAEYAEELQSAEPIWVARIRGP